jgi:hypothetical protein
LRPLIIVNNPGCFHLQFRQAKQALPQQLSIGLLAVASTVHKVLNIPGMLHRKCSGFRRKTPASGSIALFLIHWDLEHLAEGPRCSLHEWAQAGDLCCCFMSAYFGVFSQVAAG